MASVLDPSGGAPDMCVHMSTSVGKKTNRNG